MQNGLKGIQPVRRRRIIICSKERVPFIRRQNPATGDLLHGRREEYRQIKNGITQGRALPVDQDRKGIQIIGGADKIVRHRIAMQQATNT